MGGRHNSFHLHLFVVGYHLSTLGLDLFRFHQIKKEKFQKVVFSVSLMFYTLYVHPGLFSCLTLS